MIKIEGYPGPNFIAIPSSNLEAIEAACQEPHLFHASDGCNLTIANLFEEQARKQGKNIAVQCDSQSLSYEELNKRANQWARHLRNHGVHPETLVGIFLPRSIEMAWSILGIAKAGAAWVPLDPAYPKDRLAYMLRDTRLEHLITRKDLLKELPVFPAHTLFVDQDAESVSLLSKDAPSLDIHPQSLAYLIYTSGSTGLPKGVMITQENLACYVQALHLALKLRPETVYLHTATFSFSSSVRQLIAPLTAGARVVIATGDQIRNPESLWKLILKEKVTLIDLVPSYWRHCQQILGEMEPSHLEFILKNQLEWILTASEPLHEDLPRLWSAKFRHPAKILNMYGQTETTGIVSTFPANPILETRNRVVSIGRPLATTRIHILDRQMQPVAPRVDGEIYISSPSLGRGYWGMPEFTAERFLPNPFSSQPGDRLYRTGDMGRCLPDGTIEFAGRTDQQIKIRGFRVELGEIECVMNQHPGLQQAIVTVHQDPDLGPQLAAYMVSKPNIRLAKEDVRSYLCQQLPDYMVPGTLIFLEKFPLGPSGKIDRKALPRPEIKSHSSAKASGEVCDELESSLCKIWSDVLQREGIGIKDNFFELGGHSLVGAKMLSRIRETFQVDVPWSQLFEGPTVSEMAQFVRAQRRRLEERIPKAPVQIQQREEGEI